MKISRYFQSCLLVEDSGIRILIDPSGEEKDNIAKLGELDAVFYTHEHSDHFDAEMAQIFVEQGIAPTYMNASTAKQVKASKTEVQDGQEYDIKGMKVKALELPHCLMWDGSQGPQNTGYLINGKLFHAGDGKELADLTVDILAVAINGPDVSFKDAYAFAKQVSAKKIIPIHYDYLGGNLDVFSEVGKGMGLNAQVIKKGETLEL